MVILYIILSFCSFIIDPTPNLEELERNSKQRYNIPTKNVSSSYILAGFDGSNIDQQEKLKNCVEFLNESNKYKFHSHSVHANLGNVDDTNIAQIYIDLISKKDEIQNDKLIKKEYFIYNKKNAKAKYVYQPKNTKIEVNIQQKNIQKHHIFFITNRNMRPVVIDYLKTFILPITANLINKEINSFAILYIVRDTFVEDDDKRQAYNEEKIDEYFQNFQVFTRFQNVKTEQNMLTLPTIYKKKICDYQIHIPETLGIYQKQNDFALFDKYGLMSIASMSFTYIMKEIIGNYSKTESKLMKAYKIQLGSYQKIKTLYVLVYNHKAINRIVVKFVVCKKSSNTTDENICDKLKNEVSGKLDWQKPSNNSKDTLQTKTDDKTTKVNEKSTETDEIGVKTDDKTTKVNEKSTEIDKKDTKIDEVGAKVNEIGAKVNEIGTKMNEIGKKLNEIGKNLNKIGTKSDEIGIKTDGIGKKNGIKNLSNEKTEQNEIYMKFFEEDYKDMYEYIYRDFQEKVIDNEPIYDVPKLLKKSKPMIESNIIPQNPYLIYQFQYNPNLPMHDDGTFRKSFYKIDEYGSKRLLFFKNFIQNQNIYYKTNLHLLPNIDIPELEYFTENIGSKVIVRNIKSMEVERTIQNDIENLKKEFKDCFIIEIEYAFDNFYDEQDAIQFNDNFIYKCKILKTKRSTTHSDNKRNNVNCLFLCKYNKNHMTYNYIIRYNFLHSILKKYSAAGLLEQTYENTCNGSLNLIQKNIR